jgi:transposase
MDTIYRNVAGLDVHQKTIVVCVRKVLPDGGSKEEVNQFGTMTSDLLRMSEWLASEGVTHVAMESTGVLWKPVWNILDGHFELLLVNPRHLKGVPGRKTDVIDCQWIAQLLQCGLLRGSFVPSRPQRELRDLTRQRKQLTREQTRTVNRIHKTLEDANIKLGSVATDILGKSGRAMLQALVSGERDPVQLADLAERKSTAQRGFAWSFDRPPRVPAAEPAEPFAISGRGNRKLRPADRGEVAPFPGSGSDAATGPDPGSEPSHH